ncbi:hypothetical protein B0T12DRAFT_479978 [Alternaria alternata]|nr:hypothetical protein B0T12DRAFT_479978 [Alternaria alternata]
MQTMNNTEFPPHFSHFKPPVYAAQQHDHAPSRPELWPLQLSRYCKYRDGNFVIILFIPDSASSVPALQGVKAKTWVREDMFETWELCPESLEGLVDLAQQRESSGSESSLREKQTAWLASFPENSMGNWRKHMSECVSIEDFVEVFRSAQDDVARGL